MGEAQAFELREGVEEGGCQRLVGFEFLVDRREGVAGKGVSQTTAEDDPIVLGEPHVVHLRAGIVDALPVAPADRRHALGRQGLRRQHPVANGDDPVLDLFVARGKGIGGKKNLRRSDAS
ncbi:hypothetical protein D9M72_647990 [compost metagenome]